MTQAKKTKLRYAEYYGLLDTFDELYAKSRGGETFGELMSLIESEENIKLAYRCIKRNKGSHTYGTDGKDISFLAEMSEGEYVCYIQKQFANYQPKAVRRIEIPKPNGKMRPLGIPCITDRIVQQCILQILEPICEAKFFHRSHGFRPDHSAEHAIADCYRFMQIQHLHYVVDIDIKGFFDNVNHRKLMQQLWTMGIRDTKLLMIIKAILKAPVKMPDGHIEYPTKGTPQGGVLSPLLANVVLNELDWWIASQWELQPYHLRRRYYARTNSNGSQSNGCAFKAMRKTRLKEMFITRYADDFKIFCRSYKDAEKIYEAVKSWLEHRLKLEISPEKSKVTNLMNQYSEFLGFKMKLRPKGKTKNGKTRYVVVSHMCDKAIENVKKKLLEQINQIIRPTDKRDLVRRIHIYNSMVVGIHNYYQLATCINDDLMSIGWITQRKIMRRLSGKKSGEWRNAYLKDRYGESESNRWVCRTVMISVSFVQHRNPMCKKRSICSYTPEGREDIHKSLRIDIETMLYLMTHPIPDETMEYNDNRISRYAGQYGRCAVTGIELLPDEIHCHHRIPRSKNGSDDYDNLIILHEDVHKLVHATSEATIKKYVRKLNLTPKQVDKVNKLRKQAELPAIKVCEF